MRRRADIKDGMIVRLCCIVYILAENTLIHSFFQALLQQTFLAYFHLCLQVFLLFSGVESYRPLLAMALDGGNIPSPENHLIILFSLTEQPTHM